MGRIIAVASGKGGTGKTTVTANIGAALAQMGKLVVLMDMDMGLRNLDIALGMENEIVYDIADVIEGERSIDEVLLKDKKTENLYFIPAPQTRDASMIADKVPEHFWEKIKSRFDYCLIDCPAGIGGGLKIAADAADETLIVTVPEIAALRDADRAIDIFSQKDIRLIINRIRPDMMEEGLMVSVDYCMDILSIPLLAIIPEDKELIISSLKNELAISNTTSKAGLALKNAARRITGEEVPIMDFSHKKGFLDFIKKMFKR